MSERPVKEFPTLGCCGLDCGLCPRYYTVGSSRCPGCCGPEFFNKHPSCGYITCCVKKKGLEVCARCDEFPCSRFEPWLDNCGEHDSFVTHARVKTNMDFIMEHGIERFLEQQKERLSLLGRMLGEFDDGRSRSFYCIASTLLPIADLKDALEISERKLREDTAAAGDIKTRARTLRTCLNDLATGRDIELKLKK